MNKSLGVVLIFCLNNDIHAESVAEKCREFGAEVILISVDDYFSGMKMSLDVNRSAFQIENKNKQLKYHFSDIISIYIRDSDIPEIQEELHIHDKLVYQEKKCALSGFLKCFENKFHVNKPWNEDKFDNKILQGVEAKICGLKTPDTIVTSDPKEFLKFYKKCNENVVIKQLSEVCMIETLNSKINMGIDEEKAYGFYTSKVTSEKLDNIEEIRNAPCLFQEFIPKIADIRVTVIGNQVYSAQIDSQKFEESKVDFRKKVDLPIKKYLLPEKVKKDLIKLLRKWNINFAACDFALSENNDLVFLEANVSGNWLWIEDTLKFPISKELAKLILNI